MVESEKPVLNRVGLYIIIKMAHNTELIKNLITAENHTGLLESEIRIVRTNLDELYNDLTISKKVKFSLNNLNSSLNTAERLLTLASLIPKIRASANNLKTTIKNFQKPVQSALKASEKVEKIVKPIRNSIKATQSPLKKTDDGLILTMNVENNLKDAFCSASKCINSLPDSEHKTNLYSSLEKTTKALNPKVLDFDTLQIKALSSIEEAKKQSDQIRQWAERLFYLNIEINNVINILTPLISSLKGIDIAMEKVIRVPYGGYPDFCTENVLGIPVPYPCGWVTVYHSFSIRNILEGITGVLKPILDLLDSAMNAILDPLLNALNLSIQLPSIPDLDILITLENKLEGLFNHLKINIDFIPDFSVKLGVFLKDFKINIENLLAINSNCLVIKKA